LRRLIPRAFSLGPSTLGRSVSFPICATEA
jgi:hypothetical protein